MTYNLPTIFCILAAVFFGLMLVGQSEDKDEFLEKYNTVLDFSDEHSQEEEFFEWIVDQRIDKYNAELENLENSLLNLVALTVLGLLLVLYHPEKIEIPFLSISIPQTLIYFTVIFGILYIWQNLGLELNASIDSRLFLYEAMQEMGSVEFYDCLKYTGNPGHILADNGIVDNWCSFYFGIFNGGEEIRTLPKWLEWMKNRDSFISAFEGLGLFGLFGTLFGLAYGICFTAILELGKHAGKMKRASKILLIFTMLLLFFANFAWVSKHYYAALFTAYYWLCAGLFLIWWQIWGAKLSLSLSQSSDL